MTQTLRNGISYSIVALFSGSLLLWIIPGWSPEYPGYGVPATLLPNIAAGFMLVLALLGILRTVQQRLKSKGGTETEKRFIRMLRTRGMRKMTKMWTWVPIEESKLPSKRRNHHVHKFHLPCVRSVWL